MKIVFMGSATFALPTLHKLVESEHHIVEVVCQPDKPAGRGYETHACPVAEYCKKVGLNLYQPKSLKTTDVYEHLAAHNADVFVVVAYGKLLPKNILDLPKHGCVNIHASILPKYRGAAPINWAIINGESETGVCTMLLDEGMDTGDILLFCATEITDCETAQSLHDHLAPIGADLLMQTLEELQKGEVKPIPQDDSLASYAPILTKELGHIDWNKSSDEIYNRIRGLTPWPGAYCFINNKRLRLHEVAPTHETHQEKPGTILECDESLSIACGKGKLYLLEVQLEGKKKMSAKDFLHGHALNEGDVLG
ncbi:MAG: methionyl-tRNA formyltransferase [Deltaproteobacteria bacterium CG11_big_fil_rev_8_21_14_0_20_42_23]|nr:MAG: methionyl-tRNA formyltransferase [Deltaproteobacteria bacterium CG11_big_fil_rev_8_21_14_0_20_42_23]PJC64101.1 MAG: methionyl-tRNA formyltransferase [Deltaproteobacteria bacterium CG_4_9_14_0_2_um_filter_42_21]